MIYHYTILQSTHLELVDSISEILNRVKQLTKPLRLVFFADIRTNEEYELLCRECDLRMSALQLDFRPLVSIIAQPPLGGVSMYCEVTHWGASSSFTVERRVSRDELGCDVLTIVSEGLRSTFVHADSRHQLQLSIYEQGQSCFESIDRAISLGQHDASHIVRQWNYIERIVDYDGDKQHYQMFNDSRSEYYRKVSWQLGYPAATGIGVLSGGVVIDLELIEGDQLDIKPIDNHLQVSAHRYSEDLLLGSVVSKEFTMKSTPKFERAKWLECSLGMQLYVSGTAAIRGEASCQVDVRRQTELTMENINCLKNVAGLSRTSAGMYRIYVKQKTDYSQVEAAFRCNPNTDSFIMVQADVCRPELLVEIEGVF